jgi:restriction system protein
MNSEAGELRITYRGRYEMEIRHSGLNKYQIIKGDNAYVVQQKAISKMAQWDSMWAKKEEAAEKQNSQQLALEKTEEALQEQEKLETILAHTLEINDAVDWDKLKNFKDYDVPKPKEPIQPPKPNCLEPKYQLKFKILDHIFKSRKAEKINAIAKLYKSDVEIYGSEIQAIKKQYEKELKKWTMDQNIYILERDKKNAIIDKKHDDYWKGQLNAIEDYCDIVLSNSDYPDYFPQSYSLEYNPENKMLVIDYQLPAPEDIPTVIEYKYIKTRNEITEKHLSKNQINELYDKIVYQIVIRTLHEIFESDVIDAIKIACLNGYVESCDLATGKDVNGCIATIQATKEEFQQINLERIEPKACFKKLKGVGSSKLHSITPVAPLVKLDTNDKRFVDARTVIDNIDSGNNLAAMDWEDFEHLIRELFEKEFSGDGSEVKITRASRDGGVDAVVFDPDPIRGGKIVIQAKRYTNTVGVSAVRDLYGTLLNEGANKGILVTTTDYGSDAYGFAKGKPITLLNGGNLLHMLAKHGYKAKIDIAEAKAKQNEN